MSGGNAAHGGDTIDIARRSGIDSAKLLDFSANINPLGTPPGVAAVLRDAADHPDVLSAYPDPYARDLVTHIAQREGIDPAHVVVGNGGAGLLYAAVRAVGARVCVLPVPCFSEYHRALAKMAEVHPHVLRGEDGFTLDPARLIASVRAVNADLVIFSNPHNPSGTMLGREAVSELIRELSRIGCTTIVDEAFIDYAPGASVASLAADACRAIVLRSLTKFYAMPGLRIGYGFASSDMAGRISSELPSWPTGTIEQRAGIAALSDPAFDERSRRVNMLEREWLTGVLAAGGVPTAPAHANYLLAEVTAIGGATAVAERVLREDGIIVRAFAEEPLLAGAYLRLAVRTRADNERLVRALLR